MALKPVTCSAAVLPLYERVVKLSRRLKSGQCYVVLDVAAEFGSSTQAVQTAAKRGKCYALRSGVRGVRPVGVIVNPAHGGKSK